MGKRWIMLFCIAVALLSPAARAQVLSPATSEESAAEIAMEPARSVFEGQPIEVRVPATTPPSTVESGAKPIAAPQLDPQRIALALGIVLSIIFVLVWIYRRLFGGSGLQRSSGVMKVLSRVAVTPKQHVLLLQVGRRVVVVADNGTQMSPLAQIDDADEVAMLIGQSAGSASPPGGTFGAWFGRARGDYEEELPAAPAASAAVSEPKRQREIDPMESDPQVQSTRGELSGLMEKVRFLSQQFRRTG